MTPEERAQALEDSCPHDQLSKVGDLWPIICVECIEAKIRAALRERDAEHEIALKKARADALAAAAAIADEENVHEYYECAAEIASRIRALLEEAGSNGKEES